MVKSKNKHKMLTIVQSILIYGIMLCIMTYNAKRVLARNFTPKTFSQFITDKNIFVPLIVFSILAAIRWDVGVDCRSYIYGFYNVVSDRALSKGEILFYGIQDFFKFINLSHVPFFFTIAFIQIAFIYYGIRKVPNALLLFPLMFVLYGTYWSYMNGVRQSVACSIFIFTTLLLSEKKYIWAATWILIATLFHRSAYILLILGAIVYLTRKYFINRNIQLIIIAICYAMMGMSIGQGLGDIATEMLGFAGYEEGTQEHLLDTVFEMNFGLRAYMMLLPNIIVVFFSNKIRNFYNSAHFNMMYNIYFVGLCAWLLFYGNHGIERISMYLTCFIPVILAYAGYFFYNNKRNSVYKISLYIILVLLSLRTVYDMYDSSKEAIDFTNYKTIIFNDKFNI